MTSFLDNPTMQYGALGLSFVLTAAFIRAFFALLAQSERDRRGLQEHHNERERAFTEQFMACIDRNSAALEKVEQGLTRIQIQMAQNEARNNEAILVEMD